MHWVQVNPHKVGPKCTWTASRCFMLMSSRPWPTRDDPSAVFQTSVHCKTRRDWFSLCCVFSLHTFEGSKRISVVGNLLSFLWSCFYFYIAELHYCFMLPLCCTNSCHQQLMAPPAGQSCFKGDTNTCCVVLNQTMSSHVRHLTKSSRVKLLIAKHHHNQAEAIE